MASVDPQHTVISFSGSTVIPCHIPICRAIALRRFFAPQVIAYWFTSAATACCAACLISAGAGKSGNPCARFTAPCSIACRVISRMTDSVKCPTLSLRKCLPGAEKRAPETAGASFLAVFARSGDWGFSWREDFLEVRAGGFRARKTNRRKSGRYEVKTLVHLEHESRTIPAVSIDIGAHGLAVQATEPVPMSSNLTFRCVLPGTDLTLQGHADVIWASDQGRAGLFFSKLSPAARKHLKHWLSKRSAHSKEKDKNPVHDLMPPKDAHVSFSATE